MISPIGNGAQQQLSVNSGPSVLAKLVKWAGYESCCRGPVGTSRFLPMKTPLSEATLAAWCEAEPPRNPWSVALMLDTQRLQGRSVGLIIDLSNHETLYADDIPLYLQYRHIQLVAKEVPSRETVAGVISAANEFWVRHPEEFIAIHCAYGFNRTGFIVCSYLVEVAGMSIDEALDAFAAVRPPGVRHQDFVEELYCRYHKPGGPAFVSSSTAAKAVKPSVFADSAEPCQPLPKPTAQERGVHPTHVHHGAIGNSSELPPGLSSLRFMSASLPRDAQKRTPMSRSSNESCQTEEWLRRNSVQDLSSSASAVQRALDAATTIPASSASPSYTGESITSPFSQTAEASSAFAAGFRTNSANTGESSPEVTLVESPTTSLLGDLPPTNFGGSTLDESGGLTVGGVTGQWRSQQWLARLQATSEGLDHEDNESLQQDSVRSGSLSRSVSGMLSPSLPSFSQHLVHMSPAGSCVSTRRGGAMPCSATPAEASAPVPFSPLQELAGCAHKPLQGRSSSEAAHDASDWSHGGPAWQGKAPHQLAAIGSDDGCSPSVANDVDHFGVQGELPLLEQPFPRSGSHTDRCCTM